MTEKSKKQLPVYFTPKGRTLWLKCFKADTKFSIDGEFGGKLIIDNSDATDLMAQLDAMFEASIEAAVVETGKPRDKIRTNEPYEVDQETGDVTLKFKLKAIVTTKDGSRFGQKPLVVDASGKTPITQEIPLWNDSLVRVGYQVIPYYTALAGAGLSLRMKSVQIINAVAGTNESASGFDAEEGYQFDESSVPETIGMQKEEEDDFDDVPF